MRVAALIAGSLALVTAQVSQGTARADDNDYPTAARADYVFACMASNGQTSDMLERCACSIDVIASIVPYERYVAAETVIRMLQVGGEKTAMFRSAPEAKKVVEDVRRAQAEGEIRCF